MEPMGYWEEMCHKETNELFALVRPLMKDGTTQYDAWKQVVLERGLTIVEDDGHRCFSFDLPFGGATNTIGWEYNN